MPPLPISRSTRYGPICAGAGLAARKAAPGTACEFSRSPARVSRASSEATLARISASPPQSVSISASRSEGGASSTAARTVFTSPHRAAVIAAGYHRQSCCRCLSLSLHPLVSHLLQQPEPRRAPLALHRSRRNAQHLSRLLDGKPPEISQLYDPPLLRVQLAQPVQRGIQVQQVDPRIG